MQIFNISAKAHSPLCSGTYRSMIFVASIIGMPSLSSRGTVHQNLPKSIHESKKRTLLVNGLVSDSCFTEIGFTATGVTARAFLSTGV